MSPPLSALSPLVCICWRVEHVTDLDSFSFISFFTLSLSLLLPLLSQMAVSGQPCTQHIGVSNKTDDINRGMHTCTCVRAHPFPHAHIPLLIPKLSLMMAWEMCASVQQHAGNNTNPLCCSRHPFFPTISSSLPPSLSISYTFASSAHSVLSPCLSSFRNVV